MKTTQKILVAAGIMMIAAAGVFISSTAQASEDDNEVIVETVDADDADTKTDKASKKSSKKAKHCKGVKCVKGEDCSKCPHNMCCGPFGPCCDMGAKSCEKNEGAIQTNAP